MLKLKKIIVYMTGFQQLSLKSNKELDKHAGCFASGIYTPTLNIHKSLSGCWTPEILLIAKAQ